MRSAVLALLLFAAGCTSGAERAYREQIECLGLFDMQPDEVGLPPPRLDNGELRRQFLEKQTAFRTRAIEHGRAIGKSPEQVRADIDAARAALTAELNGLGAHPGEERLDQLDELCTRRLRG